MIRFQNDIYAAERFAGSDLQKYENFSELLNSYRIVFDRPVVKAYTRLGLAAYAI